MSSNTYPILVTSRNKSPELILPIPQLVKDTANLLENYQQYEMKFDSKSAMNVSMYINQYPTITDEDVFDNLWTLKFKCKLN